MNTTESAENDVETAPPKSSLFQTLISILFFGGIVVEILVTGLAILLNSDFLSDQTYITDFGTELILLGIAMVGLFIVVMLVVIAILLVISKIQGEEKISLDHFFNISFIFILGISLLIYLFIFPLLPLLQDPFNLTDISSYLSILYGLLWFVGFFFVAILALMFIYVMIAPE
jgi:hypothetical protein